MKIGTIGSGSMAQSLGQVIVKAGHEIMFGTRDQQRLSESLKSKGIDAETGTYSEATQFGDVILLVTSWGDTQSAIAAAGSLEGKILIDCSNPDGADGCYHTGNGRTISGSEEIANWASGAYVVKAFNHVYGSMLIEGTQFGDDKASIFYCGNDEQAKSVVAGLAKGIGLELIDVGTLKSARYLEPLAGLMAHLGENMKWGGENIAFKFLHRQKES
jgi:8-hydroxy-5-deazaflavin:NADPH oxidoreductase